MDSSDSEFEDKYVLKFYQLTSLEFSAYRHEPVIFYREFLTLNWTPSSLILDFGCGNGRNLPENGIGIDKCLNLMSLNTNKSNLIHCDGINLPFKDSTFDLLSSIAVLQHFCTKERRILALKESFRVLKKNGKGFISSCSDIIKQRVKCKFINENDVLIAEKYVNEYLCYYHLFKENELKELVESVGFKVLKSGLEEFNYFVVVEKFTD